MYFKKISHLIFSIFILFFIVSTVNSQSLRKSFFKVKVKRVIDGDTVVLENGERLRYAGINAPELHTEKGMPQPFAVEAYKLNKKLVEGKTLYLELSLRKRDRYGRLLGELYFENGTPVSAILVKEGVAFVCYYPGSGKYYQRYLPLQREAIRQRKGIFSLLDKGPKAKFYIGNKKSKRFHHPECSNAKKIKRKIYFKTRGDALLNGYCPARDCFDLIFSF